MVDHAGYVGGSSLSGDCINRCSWPGSDSLYIQYHDTEWGKPIFDDHKLFECLTLESAQAGLSWITILRKRENYRKAFANFDPKKVARFTEAKVQQLMQDTGIVRYELKIRAAINNAQRFLEIQKEFGSFSDYQWSFVDNKVIDHKLKPEASPIITIKEAQAFAKDLKRRGFKFLGPTTVYAHMQATGMVNDHVTTCFFYKK